MRTGWAGCRQGRAPKSLQARLSPGLRDVGEQAGWRVLAAGLNFDAGRTIIQTIEIPGKRARD